MAQKNRIISKFPFVMVMAAVIVMAIATVVENMQGTTFASTHIYSTWWFAAIWGVIAVASVVRMWQYGMHKWLTVLLLHVSFLVILLGALVTHVTSKRGYLHLRTGETAMLYTETRSDGSMRTEQLPFRVNLREFRVESYEGTMSHSDYASHLTFITDEGSLEQTVSMNNITVIEGYRFYQTSYNQDMKGSVLTVNYDPYGTGLTYAGYALLMVSTVLLLMLRTPRFKQLYKQLSAAKVVMVVGCLMLGVDAMAAQMPVIAREDADKASKTLIVYNGRVCPLNTLALDFCQKLTGKKSYKSLTAEQLLLSLPITPDAWADKELIKVKSSALKERLGISTKLARVSDFYDAGKRYKLDDILQTEMSKAADEQDKKLIRAVYDADEQISLVNAAVTGKLINYYKGSNPLSEARISAEMTYNWLIGDGWWMMAAWCLVVGCLLLGVRSRVMAVRCWVMGVVALHFSLFTFHLSLFFLRWYVSGNIPLSNGYETMQFVALSTMLLTMVAIWKLRAQAFVRNTIAVGGLLIAALTLLVAHLAGMSPQITSLMPVLHSPWLTTHVSLIMISYSMFAMMAVIAVVDMFRKDARLNALNRLMLYPAEMCLAVGIFLGAIWANQSWGTYWSWDPKEVWALISMLIYCVPLHTASLPVMQKPKVFNAYLIFAFLSILMTYFGVNYLLGGMHSYAGS